MVLVRAALLSFTSLVALPAQTTAPTRAARLQVYVLAGQSNMQGHAKIATLDGLADDPATVPLLAKLRAADGTPRVAERVWISELTGAPGGGSGDGHGKLTAGFGARRDPGKRGDNFGPEFAFGLMLEQAGVGPVLIIKTAWGGKSLHTDFRPPSAGPFVFAPERLAALAEQGKDVAAIQAEKVAATGRCYREMIEHVRRVLADPARVCPVYDAAAGFDLAGFVWFQGWNDMVDRDVYPRRDQPDGYAAYSDLLAQLVRDVRKDLAAPKLPFVIGVMGVGGPVADGDRSRVVHRNFQAAMAAPAELPEFRGNVVAVRTAPFWPADLAAIVDKVEQCKQHERALRKPAAKAGSPPPAPRSEAEIRAAVAAFRAQAISPAEEALLARGVSNAAYHYLGCGRTMAQIGAAFAAAALQLR
jgi:Carbohydrate esterase, sialic acid-specific acetylesterase